MGVQRELLRSPKVSSTWFCLLSRVHPRFLRRYFAVRSKKEKAHEGMWFLECSAVLFSDVI